MAKLTDSTVSPVKTHENLRRITFIGTVSHQIIGSELPSNRQVLEFFFFNMRFVKLTAKESARLTIDAALNFWQQAGIPTRDPYKCARKLLNMYENWKSFNKDKVERMGVKTKQKLNDFVDALDDLFDIAAADALMTIKNEEDKAFLQKQRQKGRPGSMLGIDKKLVSKERKRKLPQEKEKVRKRKHSQSLELQESYIETTPSEAKTDDSHSEFRVVATQKRRTTAKKNG